MAYRKTGQFTGEPDSHVSVLTRVHQALIKADIRDAYATDNMLEVIYFGPRFWRLDNDKITLFYVQERGNRVEIELSKPKTEHRILVSPSAIDYYIKALKVIKPFTIGR